MPQILMVVGALLALAGVGGIAAGAPDWLLGLSLGAALIQSGTVAFVGGVVLIALALVLFVLQDLLARIEMLMDGGRPLLENRAEHRAPPEPAPHPREAEPADPADEPVRPPREVPAIPGMEEALRARRERARGAPPADEAPRPRPRPTRTFDQASQEIARLREQHAQQSRRDEPAPPPSPPPPRPRREAPPPAPEPKPAPKFRPAESESAPPRDSGADTVVRSGVIGGMAYTLYADGSIEAELPIGTVRFDSIADLQDHVMRTGTEADADFDEQTR